LFYIKKCKHTKKDDMSIKNSLQGKVNSSLLCIVNPFFIEAFSKAYELILVLPFILWISCRVFLAKES